MKRCTILAAALLVVCSSVCGQAKKTDANSAGDGKKPSAGSVLGEPNADPSKIFVVVDIAKSVPVNVKGVDGTPLSGADADAMRAEVMSALKDVTHAFTYRQVDDPASVLKDAFDAGAGYVVQVTLQDRRSPERYMEMPVWRLKAQITLYKRNPSTSNDKSFDATKAWRRLNSADCEVYGVDRHRFYWSDYKWLALRVSMLIVSDLLPCKITNIKSSDTFTEITAVVSNKSPWVVNEMTMLIPGIVKYEGGRLCECTQSIAPGATQNVNFHLDYNGASANSAEFRQLKYKDAMIAGMVFDKKPVKPTSRPSK